MLDPSSKRNKLGWQNFNHCISILLLGICHNKWDAREKAWWWFHEFRYGYATWQRRDGWLRMREWRLETGGWISLMLLPSTLLFAVHHICTSSPPTQSTRNLVAAGEHLITSSAAASLCGQDKSASMSLDV
ncbi:Os02g0697900 [Oryza sativa Japonica Group]|uniref:Os02g0697900 protein n=2 Tax=Oryza sativa subsp. japonica TaxID=39947 RepID=Q0DYF0_ORYSJ|nr:hypothetical protein EE612_013089 [Oryza sativa]BAF09738.1 Os02g0697900 [Oryza sativa Japonica Group]BAS80436.1 Os02g0697900 [Oryza sativa Japonica Group]|eukprot:NP_001047824.1 Os02g0697900 [Oryza sativa Japonica Group]